MSDATGRPPAALPLAASDEPVHYVVIDDEPRYQQGLGQVSELPLIRVGGWGTVDDFVQLQQQGCHVVVLDLCLNRQTGDTAVLQGVRAINKLVHEHGQRVLVYTAEARPEPVARCVAAGAAGYVSKYLGDDGVLAQAVIEIGRNGNIVTAALHDALRQLITQCRDVRLSFPLEETLGLLDRGLSDREVADRLHKSKRTIEEHKRKILKLFGEEMENRQRGFGDLRREYGVGPGDLVNDEPGRRPARELIKDALSWLDRRNRRQT
jgi:DNA-binding NarL/FixJ family response regulator